MNPHRFCSSMLALVVLAATAHVSAQPDDREAGAPPDGDEGAVEEEPYGEVESGPANAPAPKGQAVIWGKVTDSVTGEPIVDVEVDVVGTGNVAVTNAAGEYRLVLPRGNHSVRYWTDGYSAIRARGVVVWVGAVRQIDVRLVPAD